MRGFVATEDCPRRKSYPRISYIKLKRRSLRQQKPFIPSTRRPPTVQFVLQEPPCKTFHIPEPVLARIVSLVAEDGVDDLKSWILAGPEGKDAVFSQETLSSVRLDKSHNFVRWSRPSSIYYNFYTKSLANNNRYALYVHAILLAFRSLNLTEAINTADKIKDDYPLANLLLIMLHSLNGTEQVDMYWAFRKQYPRLQECDEMSKSLLHHIIQVKPKRWGTYINTWKFSHFPDCWQQHEIFKEWNGERCLSCIFYYLSRDICLLS